VPTRPASTAVRRCSGSRAQPRAMMVVLPASMPATRSGPKQRVHPPAVVEATAGTADSICAAVSARWRSRAATNLPSSSWHCASPATSSPPVTPRGRALIGPIPVSRASMIPSRSISSATASTPADPVNEASGAPNRARRRARRRANFARPRRARNFFAWKVPSSRGQIRPQQP